MRALPLLCIALCSLALTGCSAVYSVHPLYTSEDAVEVPAIEGAWISHGDSGNNDSIFLIQKADTGKYNLVIAGTKSKVMQLYEVHLVRLDDQLFMDLQFTSQEVDRVEAGDPLGTLPHHVIAKIEVSDDDLAYAPLDLDEIQKVNEGAYLPLDYVKADDVMLVTAPTEVLRQYIADYADRVFPNFDHLTRMADLEQSP
jgi:hypothetical protein